MVRPGGKSERTNEAGEAQSLLESGEHYTSAYQYSVFVSHTCYLLLSLSDMGQERNKVELTTTTLQTNTLLLLILTMLQGSVISRREKYQNVFRNLPEEKQESIKQVLMCGNRIN